MTLDEAIEIICNDYCKYPDIETCVNKLADICDKCPMNKCEDLRWADRKTENSSEIPNNSTISKMEQVDEPIDRDDLGNCNICKYVGLEHRCNQCVNGSMFCKVEDEPQTDMAEDIVKSYGFKAESYQQAKAKDEPQTDWKKWESPPKVEHKEIITTCVSVPACLLEFEDEQ